MGKMKLAVGIILVVLGLGLVSTGYSLDYSVNKQLDESIPSVLLEIREQFLPEAEKMIKFEAIPSAMLGVRDTLTALIPSVLNGTISANTIDSQITDNSDRENFFNNVSASFAITGFSEFAGMNLSFTETAQERLLGGYTTILPGLIDDLTLGTGITEFLQKYETAINSSSQKVLMEYFYNATWMQLSNISVYLTTYLFPLVPTLGGLPLAINDLTAPIYFQGQWANVSLTGGSLTLPIGSGIDNWELGANIPSGFSLTICNALWNETNPLSPFNASGYLYWYASLTNSTYQTNLQGEFGMSPSQYGMFVSYLWDEDFQNDVIVPLVELAEGHPFAEIVLNAFYTQWSVGTLLPGGIGSLDIPGADLLTGFEVVTQPSNFSLGLRSANLWDPNNTLSLTNPSGIKDWLTIARLEGETDQEIYDAIRDTLEFAQIDLEFNMAGPYRERIIGEWLLRFRNEILPNLAVYQGEFFMNPTEFANMSSIVGLSAGGLIGFLGIIMILAYRKR